MNYENLYDVVIIGGGPAGLSAAIYAARARYRTLVLEKETFGGQITITSEIVNYPGVEKTSGRQLTESMRRQAEAFGAEFLLAEAKELKLEEDIKTVVTSRGSFQTLGVVLACGAHPRTIGFPGEKEFRGRGVAYCATCDGEFFTGKDVFVIGGGFAAAEEALFLTRYAKHVTIIVREEDFTCARSIADEVRRNENITVHYQTEIIEAGGEHQLSWAKFRNNETTETFTYVSEKNSTFGIFVFAGYEPATRWLNQAVELDKQGYILCNAHHETSRQAVFAAGDICVKDLRQVVTAVSDGALAATALEKRVAALREKLGLPKAEARTGKKETVQAGQQHTADENSGFLSSDMRKQLSAVFERFADDVIVKGVYDSSELSAEMDGFMKEIISLSSHIRYEVSKAEDQEELPCLSLYRKDGTDTGIRFHGVPGGHEINSFVIALYNTAGPGQTIDKQLKEKIRQMKPHTIKVIASLSCTMCPEVVMATQQMAALHPEIEAHMYDMAHFQGYREKYNIMSVPCIIVDDAHVHYGKHDMDELIQMVES